MVDMEFSKFKISGPIGIILPLYLALWYCFLANTIKLIVIALTNPVEQINELMVRAVGTFYPFSSILIEPVSWFV